MSERKNPDCTNRPLVQTRMHVVKPLRLVHKTWVSIREAGIKLRRSCKDDYTLSARTRTTSGRDKQTLTHRQPSFCPEEVPTTIDRASIMSKFGYNPLTGARLMFTMAPTPTQRNFKTLPPIRSSLAALQCRISPNCLSSLRDMLCAIVIGHLTQLLSNWLQPTRFSPKNRGTSIPRAMFRNGIKGNVDGLSV